MPIVDIIKLIAIGMSAGILSGLIGVGGGILVVPALIYFMGVDQHTAQGTSLSILLLPIGILAVINYYKEGNLNIAYAGIIAAAFVLGGYFGSKFSLTIDGNVLTKVFGGFMLVVGIKMIFFK